MSEGVEISPLGVVKAETLTTAELYDPKVRASAYELFLHRALSLDEIALLIGVNRDIISTWSTDGKWMRRKKAIEDELMKSVELNHKIWKSAEAFKEAQKQLAQAHHIQDAITNLMVEDTKDGGTIDDMSLKRRAEALEAASNISARAVGLGERNDAQEMASRMGKQPLVIIGLQPIVSENKGTTIDVENSEIHE
jgi:hypothetical protein